MIWDSGPWKNDIARRTSDLERRMVQKRWPEASLASVEQTVFIAAYAVRKLVEAKKLSDRVEGLTVHATTYPPRDRAVDLLNWHKLDDLYDMDAPGTGDFGLQAVCNQLIHSFVFVLDVAPGEGLRGVFVASDRQKQNKLLWFAASDITALLRRVAEDDVVSASYKRDSDTGEMKRVAASSAPSTPRSPGRA